MHRFEHDFVGSHLKLALAGYLREQTDFPDKGCFAFRARVSMSLYS
jgi:hypothetical protein